MKKFQVALQLYSVREEMEKDFAGTLQKVKDAGYDFVEFAGYYGLPAQQVREHLDAIGLTCVSVHQTHDLFLTQPQEAVAYLQTIGARYAAIPWMDAGLHAGTPAFPETVAGITRVGQLLKAGGIGLLYHNHEFEFEKHEGKFLLDWLYESVPADLLQTQIDTCWVRYAGYDPAAYILQYTGRSPVVHLKDFICKEGAKGSVYGLIDEEGNVEKPASREETGFAFRPIGHGMQDIPAILAAAEKAGAHTVVVEQDESPDRPALESARMSREYLKSLGQ